MENEKELFVNTVRCRRSFNEVKRKGDKMKSAEYYKGLLIGINYTLSGIYEDTNNKQVKKVYDLIKQEVTR